MKKILCLAAAAALCVSALSGCGGQTDEEATEKTTETSVSVDLPEGVLARVGEQEITEDDLIFYIADKLYDDMNELYNETLFADGWEDYEVETGVTAREYLLETGLDAAHQYLAIRNYAEMKGIYSDEDAEAKVLDMIENDYGGEEAFEEMLAEYYTVDAAKKYLESVGAIYAISYDICSDEDAAAEFEDNYICAKHILIQFSDDMSEDEVLAQSTEIYNKAIAGENFESLIEEYDTDTGQDAESGYVFTEGEMVDEFYEAALALEVGEISEPVRTDYGYHVIKRYALPAEGTETYDTYVENARLTAGMNYVSENMEAWMEEYPLEIDEDALSKVDLSVFTIAE